MKELFEKITGINLIHGMATAVTNSEWNEVLSEAIKASQEAALNVAKMMRWATGWREASESARKRAWDRVFRDAEVHWDVNA